ncbi:hypothetical protein F5I97DRAFT_1807258 [Phlebopus sp. FC_14]|nr:hypothetical protein F5I97DRAFT_1807258 [Phlebopus sp. FC_14]
MAQLESEDILSDSLNILGNHETVKDAEYIQYGPLKLTVAPKEGKANTLLADHLFSPALLLAELFERGLVQLGGRSVIELGAGCALPSLLAAILHPYPSLIVMTDYPDKVILGNLERNVERNREHYPSSCRVHCAGYEWGSDTTKLLSKPPSQDDTTSPGTGYDIVIMSDLLHFDASHDALVRSLTSLLAKSLDARVYVAAGKYTASHVCDGFIKLASSAGLVWEEKGSDGTCAGVPDKDDVCSGEAMWMGKMTVVGLDIAQLGVRKSMCRWWVGRWSQDGIVGWWM